MSATYLFREIDAELRVAYYYRMGWLGGIDALAKKVGEMSLAGVKRWASLLPPVQPE